MTVQEETSGSTGKPRRKREIPVQIRLTEAEAHTLKMLADIEGESMSSYIRRMVRKAAKRAEETHG